MKQTHFDYIVIGSGFGGSVSAMRLAEKGYSVLVIEKGKDIGGTKNFMQIYREIISNNEIIFFFFDVNKYLIAKKYSIFQ